MAASNPRQHRRSRVIPFARPAIELLEARTLLSTARLVFLETPGKTSEAVIPLGVSTRLTQASFCRIDVDLNHDGRFRGPGELGYAQGDLRDSSTVDLHGLVVGSYRVRARVTSSDRQFVSAVERLQIVPPTANKLPVSFEPNVGQADEEVLFLGRAQDQTVYITADETVLVSTPGEGPSEIQRFRLVGASPAAVTGQNILPGVSNYIIGNDASQWRSDITTYGAVVREGVYAGIDLVYHSSQNRLEYDFRVAPGADPADITLEFPDAVGLSIAADGSLLIHQAEGADLRKSAPVMYQEVAGRTVAVKGDWEIKGDDQAGYTIAGYDATRELVIDPIVFSTLFGGAGNDNVNCGVADAAGNFYFAGDTNSTDLPLQGAFQSTTAGGDVYITKVNAAGTAIIYSTFLGGSGGDGGNMGIAVSNTGEVAITSSTSSDNFPLLNAFQTSRIFFGDNFVSKLNAAGNALVFSTYLGSGGFESAEGVAFDSTGAVYATGQSQNGGFPTTAGAYQTTYAGGGLGGDVYVTKFSPIGAMVYSTFIGGSGDDTAQAITVFGTNAIVSGKTVSANYPTTAGAYQTFLSGGQDIFVTELNATGSALVYSTFLGGTGADGGGVFAPAKMGLTVDSTGSAYVGSTTSSNDFPTTVGAFQTTSGGSSDAILVKLNPTGNALDYSTYLGGTGNEAIYSVTLDGTGNIYYAGDSNSNNFPLRNQFQNYIGPFSANAIVGELDATGSNLLFSTMMGSGGVSGRAIGLDGSGTLWVAGPGNASVPLVSPLFAAPAGSNGFIARVGPSTPGVTVTPSGGSTNVTEGGATDNCTVVLNTPPTANVVVTFNGGTQINTNPIRLTFTPANWNVNQGMIVSAAIDFVAEGLHNGVISTVVTSTDLTYNGIAVADFTANITDDDIAGITVTQTGGTTAVTEGGGTDTYSVVLTSQPTANVNITLSPTAQLTVAPTVLTYTALNWSVNQTVTITAVNDFVAEGVHSGVLSHTTTSTDTAYNGIALASITASITDNDTAGITLTASGGSTNLAEGGATDTLTVVLTSQPTANVFLSLNPNTQVSVASPLLTFTPANWNVAQTATMTAIDDAIAEGVHSGVVAFGSTSTDPGYNAVALAALTASITDNDTAGVSVAPTGASTDVVEGGATDTYRIVLTTQPQANVVITMSSPALTTNPVAVTFTPANWNTAQIVTVAAVDDLIFQGPHTGVITHTAGSTDLPYNGLAIANLTANIADNDLPPGVIVSAPTAGLTAIEGGSDSYSAFLTTQPTADVVVNLLPDTQMSVSQTSLTFTPANWNVPQAVSVTVAEDGIPEGFHVGVISHSTISADSNYNGLSPTSATTNIVDNDGTSLLGTDKSDRILVTFTAGKIQVNINGKGSFLTAPITQLLILAGDGNDYVQVTTPTIPVVVLGGAGNDSVFVQGAAAANTFVLNGPSVIANGRSVSLWQAETLTVGGRTADDSLTIQALPAFAAEFKGDRGNDTLIAADTNNTWNIATSNTGTLNNTFKINGVEHWTGGSGDDTYLFAPGKGVTGTINGGAGTNTLDYSAYLTPVSINLQTATATGTKAIQNVQNILGGAAADKLTGRNQANTWTITTSNAGDVNGLRFQSFENLTGGTFADTFVLPNAYGVRGKIDGGAGTDVLDYSNYVVPVAVNLQGKTATNTGGFVNLESFLAGSSGVDSLIAVNIANNWNLTGIGTGTVNSVAFADFENLTGGTTVDRFTLGASGGWTGLVNGMGGNDSLLAFPGGINIYISISKGAGTLNGSRFSSIESSQ